MAEKAMGFLFFSCFQGIHTCIWRVKGWNLLHSCILMLTGWKIYICISLSMSGILNTRKKQFTSHPHCPQKNGGMYNWRAQSKNDPLIFWPFLKVFRSSWILACGHFQKWPKNQGIILALSPPIKLAKAVF